MKEWLSGKKTYIIVVLGVIINGLWAMGLIDEETVKIVDGILLFTGLGTVRAGISKGGVK